MASTTRYVTASALRDFGAAIFERLGLPGPHALIVADCLVKANLRGLDSHGVSRIPIYAKRLRLGLVNPRPALTVSQVAPSAAHLDGDDGMGMVVGTKAMETAIALARDTVRLVTKYDRLVRANLNASGHESFVDAMCAAGAFLCNVKFPVHINDAVGTRLLAESATCAGLGVYPHQPIIPPPDGVLGAGLDAGGIRAMLAKNGQIGHPDLRYPAPLD